MRSKLNAVTLVTQIHLSPTSIPNKLIHNVCLKGLITEFLFITGIHVFVIEENNNASLQLFGEDYVRQFAWTMCDNIC